MNLNMGKYIDSEKLKTEIERRRKFHDDAIIKFCNNRTIALTHSAGLKEDEKIVELIDSLQQEQPDKVDFEDVWKTYYDNHLFLRSPMPSKRDIARYFYELGQQEMRRRITNPEYNAKVVERLKSEYPTTKEE